MTARCVIGCLLVSLTAAARLTPPAGLPGALSIVTEPGVVGSGLDRPGVVGPVLWAWERREDLRFAGPHVSIAVLAGTVRLSGAEVAARPRLQPALVLPSQTVIGVVHLEIDRTRPLAWTTDQRAQSAAVVLALLKNPRFAAAQIDFEVRASQRQVLLDVLTDARSGLIGLPAGRHLSMTALASWCDTESWIAAAPVDEIVPMMFRMGRTGEILRQRLAGGGDFREPRCRTSVGVATDTPADGLPLDVLPAGRRVWVFNPRAWTADDLETIQDRLHS